jgi:hypothetical protein
MVRIGLLTIVLLFVALSMLYRAWRMYQALQSGAWPMRGAPVTLADRPNVYWRITILNGVTLAVSLCAAVILIQAIGFSH